MGAVKQAVSAAVRMLNRKEREANRLPASLHKLEKYLREEPKNVISWSLFLVLTRIEVEANKRTRGAVILISPEGKVSVEETYNVDSDSRLKRLKSRGFSVLTLEEFRSFVESLGVKAAEENYTPAIEFLRANAEFRRFPFYPAPSVRKADEAGEPSAPSGWKASDFLPAPLPYPPLPRGLFKD